MAKYDRFREDVRGHEIDEVIVGYIPPDAKITFEDSDNGTFAVVDGVISKLYANDVYEMYNALCSYGFQEPIEVVKTVAELKNQAENK